MSEPERTDPDTNRTLEATGPYVQVLTETAAQLGTVGRYRLLDRIGQGGMGGVYRGLAPALGRELAVKVLLTRPDQSPESRADLAERFLAEARVTGQLQHPGVPPVHELGRLPDGRPFFAMKLIQGQTLADL